MLTLSAFLVFCQALGAITGAVTAVWGELAYIKDMKDGRIDSAEHAHITIIARGLKFGMMLLLLSSIGLLITSFNLHSVIQPAQTSAYWILTFISLLVIGVSWAMSRQRVSFLFGSALVFTGWWFIVYLTLGLLSPLKFGVAVVFLVVSTGIVYGLLYYLRLFAHHLARK